MKLRNWRDHLDAKLRRDCPTCKRKAGHACTGTLGAQGGNGYVHVARRKAGRAAGVTRFLAAAAAALTLTLTACQSAHVPPPKPTCQHDHGC